ncbi:thioredoxin domain-containing protein [Streptomyces sp. NBC_00829]|uniref:thioredoxin domain-containing protein n=1 Tax=Streptomyces sp. NBC_00829 TaxID=2903679 RepID=UPI00386A6307|nr:DsbA family protein [Streptomyces sp. NBC_00829]
MVRGGRWAVVCAAAVLVLAGCGQRHLPPEPKEPYAGVEQLPESLDADGTTITVGDPEAAVTVHLYEDPRCPTCKEFETAGGALGLREATVRREVKSTYTLASFLDDRVGGSGSKKAVNALRAALEKGKFAQYHEVLYANQPDESVDGYTDAHLLKLAEQVKGLRGPDFDLAVKSMKYRVFVAASEQAYERAGGAKDPRGPGTPTADINGKRIPPDYSGILVDHIAFPALLQEIYAAPWKWKGF